MINIPRKDGTGPDGLGSKTGRGLGPCGTDEGNNSKVGRRGKGRKGR
ncbi:DUF5320 domain-containing protein [Natroniella acetigena]|nr:DUF5320 domain-containing protein [Natroniella acetigena]